MQSPLTEIGRAFEHLFNIKLGDIHKKHESVIKRKPSKVTEFLDTLRKAIAKKARTKAVYKSIVYPLFMGGGGGCVKTQTQPLFFVHINMKKVPEPLQVPYATDIIIIGPCHCTSANGICPSVGYSKIDGTVIVRIFPVHPITTSGSYTEIIKSRRSKVAE